MKEQQQHTYSVSVQFSRSVVSASPTSCTAAHQTSLSINSQSLLRLMSVASVMPSNRLILCHPILLLPSIFPGIRVFSNEPILPTRWPKYWSFTLSISPSNKYSGLVSFGIAQFYLLAQFDLLAFQVLSRNFSNTTVQKHQLFCVQLSSQFISHIPTLLLQKPVVKIVSFDQIDLCRQRNISTF